MGQAAGLAARCQPPLLYHAIGDDCGGSRLPFAVPIARGRSGPDRMTPPERPASTFKKTPCYLNDGIARKSHNGYHDFNLFTCDADTHSLPAANPSYPKRPLAGCRKVARPRKRVLPESTYSEIKMEITGSAVSIA